MEGRPGFHRWAINSARALLESASVHAYMTGMLALIFLWLATVLAMEGFAYVMHRWVMHGPGWFLHKSHHRPRDGRFELNDLYALIFAVPSVLLINRGIQGNFGGWAIAVGVGIATYGLIYFGFHDVIVHRRMPHRFIPKSPYMKRIVQAHRLHHAVESKRDGLSFGFLVAPPVDRLVAQLDSSRARLRAPAGGETSA